MDDSTPRELAWRSVADLHAEGRVPIPLPALDRLAKRGWLGENGLRELVCPPRHITPSPAGQVEGAWFDVAEVEFTLGQFCSLRHTKGRRHAGRPFRPMPWQVLFIIGPVFGWKHSLDDDVAAELEVEPGSRVIREAFIEVPRKAGKSSVCSAIALKLLAGDDEPGAEVYAAAKDKDQARLVFEPAKVMGQRSPALAATLQFRAGLIRHPKSTSFFRALASIADAAHGLNPSGAVVDEIHVHKSRDLYDVIQTGSGARAQPLIVSITTADDNQQGTLYDDLHTGVIRLEAGTVDPEPETYGVIFAAAEDADPFEPVTWWSCNPSLPETPTLGYLRKEATKARNRPSYFPAFTRLHLNQRSKGGAGMFNLELWGQNAAPVVDVDGLAGRECYGGVVVTSTVDLASVVWVFPTRLLGLDGNLHDGYEVVARTFLPEGALDKETGRRGDQEGMLRHWAEQGWLTLTEGDAIDYQVIEEQVAADLAVFQPVEAAYLRWQAEQFRQRLVQLRPPQWKDDPDWVFPLSSSMDRFAAPTEEMFRALELGVLQTGGNPVLSWQARNAASKVDAEKRTKVDSEKSKDAVPGITALTLAIASAIRERKPIPEAGFEMM